MKKLSLPAQKQAVDFLKHHARPLEYAQWQFFSGEITLDVVLSHLAAFSNEDGGFGQGIEPDQRSQKSSVLGCCEALEMMYGMGVSAHHPLVNGALDWLEHEGMSEESGLWPYLPDDLDDAPSAPWWNLKTLSETFDHFVINPRGRVHAAFFQFSRPLPESQRAVESIIHYVQQQETLPPDSVRSVLRLYEAKNLPEMLSSQLELCLQRILPASMETDSNQWSTYGLQPLEVVTHPESPFYPLLQSSVERQLDYLIETQQANGSWAPFWTWGGTAYPQDHADSFQEWSGILTLRYLRILQKFARK